METSAESVRRLAATLDEIAVPFCVKRLEELGERESGAYNFYAERLRRGTIFGDYELALVSALTGWSEAPTIAHEIGCGYATLSLLLAGVGFQCVALEVDQRRYAGALALREEIRVRFPELANSCRLLNQRFPVESKMLPQAGAFAITTNLVFTTTETSRNAIFEGLARYPWAIVDVDRFLTAIREGDERALRVAEFDRRGLAGEPFLNLGPSARFYRFGDGTTRSPDAAQASKKTRPTWLRRLDDIWRRRSRT
jgi:hypothetical protein